MTTTAPESPIKPQVIDLEAEDITVEENPSPPPPPPHPVSKRNPRTTIALIAVAALAGAIGGGWVYKDFLATYLPSNEMLAAQNRIEVLEAQSKVMTEQLTAVASAEDQLKSLINSLDAQMKAAAENSKSATEERAAAEARIAAIEAASNSIKTEIAELKTLIEAGVPASATNDSAPQLQALVKRLEALEKQPATTPQDNSVAASRLTQSLSDLKAKIAAGTAYRAEVDKIAAQVPAAAGLDTLLSRADAGLPNAQGLAAELNAIIPQLPKPVVAATPAEESYADSLWNALGDIITIRQIGETDWPALASQTAALAEAGDLAEAIKKIDGAEGAKPVALNQWRERAAARLILEAALEETSTAVLRQIATMSAAP